MPRGGGSVFLIAVGHATRSIMAQRAAGGLKLGRTRLHMRRFPLPEKLGRGLGGGKRRCGRRTESGGET